MGDLAHDDRNRNPHTTDAGPAPHDLRIKCNAVEHAHHLILLLSIKQRGFGGFPPLPLGAQRFALAKQRAN